ncbi:MAG: asparagine synthase-related protein, partial [Myxococcota bacterium]
RARVGPAGAVPPQTRWGKLADVLEQRGQLVELYQLAYGLFVPAFLAELAPGLAAAPVHMGLSLARAERLSEMVAGQPPLHAISQLELMSFVGERLLPDTDMTSMAVALEARVPLLDHRVVEAAAGVPIARRFEPLGRKQLLRDVALGALDPVLFDRPQRGFELPLEVWVRRDLRGQVDDTLRDRDACLAVGLDPAVVGRLWEAFQAGAPGLYWSRIWALFVLLRWCRRHRLSL